MDDKLQPGIGNVYLVQVDTNNKYAYTICTDQDIIMQKLRIDDIGIICACKCVDPDKAKYLASLFFQVNFTTIIAEHGLGKVYYYGNVDLMRRILLYASNGMPEGSNCEDSATHISFNMFGDELRVLFYRNYSANKDKPFYRLLGWKCGKATQEFSRLNLKYDKIYDIRDSRFPPDMVSDMTSVKCSSIVYFIAAIAIGILGPIAIKNIIF